jgi:FixJ family two-component response regulator
MQATSLEENIGSLPLINTNLKSVIPFKSGGGRQSNEIVFLVSPDSQVRETLSMLLGSLEIEVECFRSAAEFCCCIRPDKAACLIVDAQFPDIDVADLQQRIGREMGPPFIFISGHTDVASTVRAMKAGAIEFLTKPVDSVALVDAVHAAHTQDRKVRLRKAELKKLQERLCLLTPREREVLPLTVGGLLNKQAASILGISEVTLQIHRSQVMRKMQAESFADLVRMAMKLRIPYWSQSQPWRNQDTGHAMVSMGGNAWSSARSAAQ